MREKEEAQRISSEKLKVIQAEYHAKQRDFVLRMQQQEALSAHELQQQKMEEAKVRLEAERMAQVHADAAAHGVLQQQKMEEEKVRLEAERMAKKNADADDQLRRQQLMVSDELLIWCGMASSERCHGSCP